ncbi:hypothetical protein OF83DRAFT_1177686 [Amylostereum chailletii]|nr:hypothetical protein OF83DRAFT_1177686 [Amylostereum chailletii]
MNMPICGAAAMIVILSLRVRTPPGTIKEKLERIDWIGNLLVIGSTMACCIALTWIGVEHSRSSVRVLVLLIFGLVGLAFFLIYEASGHRAQTSSPFYQHMFRRSLSRSCLPSPASADTYLQTSLMPVAMLGLIYYIPVYFQACKGASPIRAGVDQRALAFVLAPAGIVASVSVKKPHKHRPQLWLSWILLIVGLVLFTTLDEGTPVGIRLASKLSLALVLVSLPPRPTSLFWLLVSVPPSVSYGCLTTMNVVRGSHNGLALAFFMFLRNFAQVRASPLVDRSSKRTQKTHSSSTSVRLLTKYSNRIPIILTLEEPLRTQVHDSLRVVWFIMLAIAGFGMVSSLFMKALPLHTGMDQNWAFEVKVGKDELKREPEEVV